MAAVRVIGAPWSLAPGGSPSSSNANRLWLGRAPPIGSGNGLGTRSRRYSMLIEDGVVKKLNIEEAPGKVEVSGGDALLKQL